MLFNKIYDRINHLILSVQNQNKWFMKLGTSNCANCSRRNPKHSAKYVYHTGTLAPSIARAGTCCVKEEGRIINSSSIRWTSFQIRFTSSRKDDVTDIDTVRSGETENIIRPTSWRRSARSSSSRVSMIDSNEMKKSSVLMVETKVLVNKWMLLRKKIILTIWLHKNITIAKVIDGFVRTRQVPILCQCSGDLTSNKHCLPCSNWNKKKNDLYKRPRNSRRNQQWAQSSYSSSSSWWSWKGSWWTPYSYESHHGDEPSTDRTGLTCYTSIWNKSSRHDFL